MGNGGERKRRRWRRRNRRKGKRGGNARSFSSGIYRLAALRFLLIEFRLSDRFGNNDNDESGKEKGRGNLETSASGERLINWFFVAN